jgi:hypothetical protein
LLKVPRRLPVADLAEASFKQIRTKIFTIWNKWEEETISSNSHLLLINSLTRFFHTY